VGNLHGQTVLVAAYRAVLGCAGGPRTCLTWPSRAGQVDLPRYCNVTQCAHEWRDYVQLWA